MTVRDMLSHMDSRELTEWMAYEKVSGPIGPDRSDIHTGIVASTTANAMKGKRGKKFEPKDFIPDWDSREQSWEDQLRAVKGMHRSITRNDRRRALKQQRQKRESREVSDNGHDR